MKLNAYVCSGTYTKQPFVDGGPNLGPMKLSLKWRHENKVYTVVYIIVAYYYKVVNYFHTYM